MSDARSIADARLAKGEITQDEHTRIVSSLGAAAPISKGRNLPKIWFGTAVIWLIVGLIWFGAPISYVAFPAMVLAVGLGIFSLIFN